MADRQSGEREHLQICRNDRERRDDWDHFQVRYTQQPKPRYRHRKLQQQVITKQITLQSRKDRRDESSLVTWPMGTVSVIGPHMWLWLWCRLGIAECLYNKGFIAVNQIFNQITSWLFRINNIHHHHNATQLPNGTRARGERHEGPIGANSWSGSILLPVRIYSVCHLFGYVCGLCSHFFFKLMFFLIVGIKQGADPGMPDLNLRR